MYFWEVVQSLFFFYQIPLKLVFDYFNESDVITIINIFL